MTQETVAERDIAFTTNAEDYVARRLLLDEAGEPHSGRLGMIEGYLGIQFAEVTRAHAVFDGTATQERKLRQVFHLLSDQVEKQQDIFKSTLIWALEQTGPKATRETTTKKGDKHGQRQGTGYETLRHQPARRHR